MSKATQNNAAAPRCCLIDAHAYIHRAYHALPPLTNSKGEPVNAVFGFARMLLKVLRQNPFQYVAVVFDHPSATFRHKLYNAYKAHRPQAEEELKHQFPLVRDLVKAWGLPFFDIPGVEADDVIATLARQAEDHGCEVTIVSGDKDALQLVDDKIKVLSEPKGILYDRAKVQERYGVSPAQLRDFFALIGDTSDNVPGVPGIGEKTAGKLLSAYTTLKGVLEHAGEISGKAGKILQEHKKQALLSRELISLKEDVELPQRLEDCIPQEVRTEEMTALLKRLEFGSLIPEFLAQSKTSELSGQYQIIAKPEDLEDLVRRFREAGRFAVDLETTGLDPFQDTIVGISGATGQGLPCYIPIGHQYPGAPAQLDAEKVWKILWSLLEDPNVQKYGHNIKFDLLCLRKIGIDLQGVAFDSMVASYCLNPSRSSHGLKELALEYLGHRMTTIEELIGKGTKQISMAQVDVARAGCYAADDAQQTWKLSLLLEKQLHEEKLERLFYEVEMPLVPILADMEETGMAVDLPYLKALKEDFAKESRTLEKEIVALAGQEFNLNSPKQLGFILFEKLKLPVIRKTKTGYSTDEEVLKTLSLLHPLPQKLMEYRTLQKLESTYVDALLAVADPQSGRVHTNFHQTVAATGRLSSSNPNLQNIPIRTAYGRRIRRAFVAPAGHVFLSADYSQIDLRTLAHVSCDESLCQAFRSERDIHTATAQDVFHVTADQVTAELRRKAKAINFGIVYGQQAFGLSQSLGISISEAKDYIERYFQQYSGVARWSKEVVEQARLKGFVTTILGRLRYLPEINSKNAAMRNFAERTALNTPIQGSSADIIKVAMIHLWRALRAQRLRSKMILQVHDDLLFEVPEEELPVMKSLVKKEMETAVTLKVPLVVDLKWGKNWEELSGL